MPASGFRKAVTKPKKHTNHEKYIAIAAIAGSLFLGLSSPACASFTFTIQQVGDDVVATGFGSINLTALSIVGSTPNASGAFIRSLDAGVHISPGDGNTPHTSVTLWGWIDGPLSIGTGTPGTIGIGSGTAFGVANLGGAEALVVDQDYVSGTPLSTSGIWENTTLAGLGLTPDTTFTWTWGSAENSDADSVTVDVVPEPSTYALVGFGLLTILLFRKRLAPHRFS